MFNNPGNIIIKEKVNMTTSTPNNVVMDFFHRKAAEASQDNNLIYEKYFNWQISVVKKVPVTRINSDKSDPELMFMVQSFLELFNLESGGCYINTHKLIGLFPDELQYVEGYIPASTLAIEHCWVYFKKKDIYFDMTNEINLGDDVEKKEYFQIIKVDSDEVLNYIKKMKLHNSYMIEYYKKISYKQNNKNELKR